MRVFYSISLAWKFGFGVGVWKRSLDFDPIPPLPCMAVVTSRIVSAGLSRMARGDMLTGSPLLARKRLQASEISRPSLHRFASARWACVSLSRGSAVRDGLCFMVAVVLRG